MCVWVCLFFFFLSSYHHVITTYFIYFCFWNVYVIPSTVWHAYEYAVLWQYFITYTHLSLLFIFFLIHLCFFFVLFFNEINMEYVYSLSSLVYMNWYSLINFVTYIITIIYDKCGENAYTLCGNGMSCILSWIKLMYYWYNVMNTYITTWSCNDVEIDMTL